MQTKTPEPGIALFEQVAKAFRTAMARQDMTQAELAQKTGLTPRTVCLLLSGKHNFKLSSLGLIADTLGLEVSIAPKLGTRAPVRQRAPAAVATEVLALDAYAPGARVLERIVRRYGGTMTPALALSQWEAVAKVLREKGLLSAAREALESSDGGLDTAPREHVMDAWGLVCVGRPWPANMDGEAAIDAFIRTWGQYLQAQGAKALPREETVL